MVQRQEVEENIGLIWYNPQSGSLTTKKKAVYRNIEIDGLMLLYIIMNRLDSDRVPFMLHKEEAFSAWLKGKESNRSLAWRIKSKLLAEKVRLESEIRQIERYKADSETLMRIRDILYKHGIKGLWHIEEKLEDALSRNYPPELEEIRRTVQQSLTKIDQIISASQ